jgi:O-antigen ligase
MNIGPKLLRLLATLVIVVLLFVAAERRPGYFVNTSYFEALLLLEVLLVTVWQYERWFFLVMMFTFLWAGSELPLAEAGATVRWVFLAVGALVGIVKWAERDLQKLKAIDIVALLCVLSAAVSSLVSGRMEVSLLKSASLLLVFLYGLFGARVAVVGREGLFFPGLLIACEVISYLAGLSYAVLRFEVFGNPNSLGAVMGVVVVPVLLWGVLTTQNRHVRHRRTFALCLATCLLFASVSRAGILACAVAVTVMCIALRRQDLLIKGAFVLVFLAALVAVVQPGRFDALVSAFTEDVIYKGKPEEGLLGSRKSSWQESVEVITANPWFGGGFGTDVVRLQPAPGGLLLRASGGSVREHGNSYLALLEYVGLLGIIPFIVLLCLVLREIYRGYSRMWSTRDARPYTVPLVLVCTAGLLHAFFEDWLFAVGFYLNIFFWTSVFVLAELQSERATESVMVSRAWNATPVSGRQVPFSPSR